MSNKIRNERLPRTDDSVCIPWEEYETTDAEVRDGLSPEEYIRKIREEDCEEQRVER